MKQGIGRRGVFFLLFTISGFSGLIYESIWTHYLKLFLGHAAYAQTLVLAIFMGGMAIGSWACSRFSMRWKNLLLGYALAEGAIGLCALVFHPIFTAALDLSYGTIIPQLGKPALVYAFQWSLSALIILPQSILLGMTFPLMSAGILRLFPDRPGRSIALLYFTNSIGAAAGVLMSGFLLIRLVGLPGTVMFAGFINIVLALTVWTLVRKSAPTEERSGLAAGEVRDRTGVAQPRLLLLVSLATGTASFIYEIGWIRMLSLVLGTSTHAFELMLSAFILGLAFGGLWIQRRIDTIASPIRYLAGVQLVMGLLALSTLVLYGNTFEVMQWIVRSLPRTDAGYTLFNLSSSGIAMAIMLPTTFCAGMTLPLITFTLLRRGYGERSIGAVYAANTVGAIIGVFFAIHLGMPLLGLKGLITFGAALDIALGVALYWGVAADYSGRRVQLAVTVVGVVAVAGTLFFVQLDPYKMASGVYRLGHLFSNESHALQYHQDGKTATVSLLGMADGSLAINTNGKTDAAIMMKPGGESTTDESTMSLCAILPLALNPHVRTAATIGLGSGLTSQTLLSYPLITAVDTVEIEKKMVEAARFFRPRVDRVYTDPRSRIYIDDAKTFFSTTNRKYDLIVSEPSNPWVSGVAGLFSEEFYRRIHSHLNDNGLFVQWVQLYEIDVDLVLSVLKAISGSFPDYAVYASHDYDLFIIAVKNGALPAIDPRVLSMPEVAAPLRHIYIAGAQDIELRRIGDKQSLHRFIQSFPIRANSDYFPVLDQNAARARFLGKTASELTGFMHFPLPAQEMLSGTRAARQTTSIVSSPHYLESRAAETAMGLSDYFLHGGFVPGSKAVSPELRQQAAMVRALFRTCPDQKTQDRSVGSLFAVSIAMTPYLAPAELDAVWRALEKGPCRESLTPHIRQAVALFKAIGRRDGQAMSESARTMLDDSRTMTRSTVKYLVSAAMLGSLAQGDRQTAAELWARYSPVLFGDSKPDLLLQVLAAESTGR